MGVEIEAFRPLTKAVKTSTQAALLQSTLATSHSEAYTQQQTQTHLRILEEDAGFREGVNTYVE